VIYIIDFNAGNLKSAAHAFNVEGKNFSYESCLINSPAQIKKDPEAFILPGDGSFPFAATFLEKSGFASLLKKSRVPLMGICVGFQLLFEYSEEHGGAPGLGLIPGKVVEFNQKCFQNEKSECKIPHMGWNTVTFQKESPLLKNILADNHFYFVHSFYPQGVPASSCLLNAHYGVTFPAAVSHDNICGFQFHPEKSHRPGRQIIKNFIASLPKKIK